MRSHRSTLLGERPETVSRSGEPNTTPAIRPSSILRPIEAPENPEVSFVWFLFAAGGHILDLQSIQNNGPYTRYLRLKALLVGTFEVRGWAPCLLRKARDNSQDIYQNHGCNERLTAVICIGIWILMIMTRVRTTKIPVGRRRRLKWQIRKRRSDRRRGQEDKEKEQYEEERTP